MLPYIYTPPYCTNGQRLSLTTILYAGADVRQWIAILYCSVIKKKVSVITCLYHFFKIVMVS